MRPDPWMVYLLRTRDLCRAEGDRIQSMSYAQFEGWRSPGAKHMAEKLHYDACFIDDLIRGFRITAMGESVVFEPQRGDAIRARCAATGRWVGGVIRAVSVREGFASVCAGSYCFVDHESSREEDMALRSVPGHVTHDGFPDAVRCSLEGATIVRGRKAYVEAYRDSDSVVYEEQEDA